jgi:hypothetical protein
MTFTACKSRSTARRRYPNAALIVKVDGGYMCFTSTTAYLWACVNDVRLFDSPVASALRRRNVKSRIFDWKTEFPPKDEP